MPPEATVWVMEFSNWIVTPGTVHWKTYQVFSPSIVIVPEGFRKLTVPARERNPASPTSFCQFPYTEIP